MITLNSLLISEREVMAKPNRPFEIGSHYLISLESRLEWKIAIARKYRTLSLDTTHFFLVLFLLLSQLYSLAIISPFVILHITLRPLLCLQDAGPFLAGCSYMLIQSICNYLVHLFAV